MSTLISYGNEVHSIFQLLGENENSITLSISWALSKCPAFMKSIVREIFNIEVNPDDVLVHNQRYDTDTGITDIELKDSSTFHIIFEAKRGWALPGAEQLTKYSLREDFANNPVEHKAIVSMSECSKDYASFNLPFQEINGVPVMHLSWKDVYKLAYCSRTDSNYEQKNLILELQEYLKGIMTMQNKYSNLTYVVALSAKKPENCSISWLDIVQKLDKYCCPVGINGWPKEPPNYIAFRYDGKLQSIHHIDNYITTKNLHDEVEEISDEVLDNNHFVFKLGPAIIPAKEVKTGKIYPNGRVWAMLDTLLTSDTISQARDITRQRLSKVEY